MLKKLLKYDMKSMVRMLVPLSLAVMGTTVAGTASLRIMQNVNTGTSTSWILTSTLMIVFISTILALIAFSIFSQILIMYRYYTNLFTDEGYLTFTLPVKTTSILTSKVINAMIWSAYSLLIIFFCIFIYVAFGMAEGSHLINSEIFRELKDGIRILTETYSAGIIVKYIIEFLVFLFVSLLYGTISIYLALTIGSIIAKKHKILAAIGIYYGINMIMSLFITIINSILSFSNVYQFDYFANIAADKVFDIAFYINAGSFLIFSVISYLITRQLLKNKLNLS